MSEPTAEDGDEGYDEEEIKRFFSEVEVDVAPCVKFGDICGIQEAVEKVKESIILPAKFPQLFTGGRRGPGTFLLYGPPGTGKTLLVQVTIAELMSCDTRCYRLSAYTLLSRWLQSPVKALRALFEKGKGHKHCVLFIEDFEVLSRQHNQQEARAELSNRLNKELITQIYNMRSGGNICVVGITNGPWKLAQDCQLRRVMVRRVYTPLPDRFVRCALFKQKMASAQHSLSEEDFRMFAERSEGFSGSDVVIVAMDACMQPIRRIQVATHFKHVSGPSPEDPKTLVDDLLTPCSHDDPGAMAMAWTEIAEDKKLTSKLASPVVTVDDVMKSLSVSKPSVSKEELDMYQTFYEEFGG